MKQKKFIYAASEIKAATLQECLKKINKRILPGERLVQVTGICGVGGGNILYQAVLEMAPSKEVQS